MRNSKEARDHSLGPIYHAATYLFSLLIRLQPVSTWKQEEWSVMVSDSGH